VLVILTFASVGIGAMAESEHIAEYVLSMINKKRSKEVL
jgi:peptidyl-tRNA hydrolase